jgi:hypothetical protein
MKEVLFFKDKNILLLAGGDFRRIKILRNNIGRADGTCKNCQIK